MRFVEVIESHPNPSDLDREVLLRCVSECLGCSASCTACADACLSESDLPAHGPLDSTLRRLRGRL